MEYQRKPGTQMILSGESADKLEALVDAVYASEGDSASPESMVAVMRAAIELVKLCGKKRPLIHG